MKRNGTPLRSAIPATVRFALAPAATANGKLGAGGGGEAGAVAPVVGQAVVVSGPVWVVDQMVRPDCAVAVFLVIWVYLLGKAMWSAWRIFSPERRVHRELAAMVQRAERW